MEFGLNNTGQKIIAVDVDLTVVDTMAPWLTWIERSRGHQYNSVFNLYGFFSTKKWLTEYDKMPEFAASEYLDCVGYENQETAGAELKKLEKHLIESWMGYWKQPDLYKTLKIEEEVLEALKTVISSGAQLLFISHCIQEHKKSKMDMLTHYFGNKHKFIDTRLKEFINYDVLIDDNPLVIKEAATRNPRKDHIMFTGYFLENVNSPIYTATPSEIYKQAAKDTHEHFKKCGPIELNFTNEWSDIGKFLKGE